jgi:hypothetical protein
MVGIKATNSRNLTVNNCRFSGFETDIELENVEGFLSEHNEFSKDSDPSILMKEILNGIKKSNLDKCSQERLYKDVITLLTSKRLGHDEGVESIKNRIFQTVGSKVSDYFVQLVAAVSAGLIIHKIQ